MNKFVILAVVGVFIVIGAGSFFYFQSSSLQGPPEPAGGTFPVAEPSSRGSGINSDTGESAGGTLPNIQSPPGTAGGSSPAANPPPSTGGTGVNPSPTGSTGSTGQVSTQTKELDAASTQFGSMNSSVQGIDDSTDL